MRRKRHKQSGYFTLMMVPYSSSKTKTIRIPHAYFYAAGLIVFLALSTFLFAKLRGDSYKAKVEELETLAQNKQEDFERIVEENWDLQQEKNSKDSDIEKQKKQYQTVIEGYKGALETYGQKAEELRKQLEELDKTKKELYDLLQSKIGYDPGVSFTEVLGALDYAGSAGKGAFVSQKSENQVAASFASLEREIQKEIYDFAALKTEIKKQEPYIKALPKIWPIKGVINITSYFGDRQNPFSGSGSESHLAIDLQAGTGTAVYATGAGTVSFAGLQGGYGYLIIIDHGFGINTYYAHNSRLMTAAGKKVARGDLIAYSGSTGRSTGPHVHYEVRVDNVPKNPLNYIN
jgi:murein DD-endopeptidase MepM/ murein hydrolase activator NlpD